MADVSKPGFSLLLRSRSHLGSALLASGLSHVGALLPLRSSAHVGAPAATPGMGRVGSAFSLLVLDMLRLGSPMLSRSHTWLEVLPPMFDFLQPGPALLLQSIA